MRATPTAGRAASGRTTNVYRHTILSLSHTCPTSSLVYMFVPVYNAAAYRSNSSATAALVIDGEFVRIPSHQPRIIGRVSDEAITRGYDARRIFDVDEREWAGITNLESTNEMA